MFLQLTTLETRWFILLVNCSIKHYLSTVISLFYRFCVSIESITASRSNHDGNLVWKIGDIDRTWLEVDNGIETVMCFAEDCLISEDKYVGVLSCCNNPEMSLQFEWFSLDCLTNVTQNFSLLAIRPSDKTPQFTFPLYSKKTFRRPHLIGFSVLLRFCFFRKLPLR